MKKILLILFLAVALVGCNFGGEPTTTAEVIIDTENYLELTTVEDLKNIEMNKSYILMNDLDLTAEEWLPLGTIQSPFLGNFNGNGMTISNLTITDDNHSYNGLFGYVKGNITSLKITDFEIEYETKYISFVGGLAGLVSGDVSNVEVEGMINVTNTSSNTYAGLLVGSSQKSLNYDQEISNFTANEITNNQVSGMITVSGERIVFAGGLLGKAFNTLIENNTVDVTLDIDAFGNMLYVGGLIGHNYSGLLAGYEQELAAKKIIISENIVTSVITAFADGYNTYAGGLVGYNLFGKLYDNFSQTEIETSGLIIASGYLVGEDWNGQLRGLVGTGSIDFTNQENTETFINPIIGRSFGLSITTNSYWASDLQTFEDISNQVSDADLTDVTWYQDTLEWNQEFINLVIDSID